MFLKPSEIFYTQDSIAWKFRKGGYVKHAIIQLLKGHLSVEDFPTIQVIKRRDGKYYSLDNRRLYVFRVGQYHGFVAKVPVEVVMEQPLHRRKFTTKNGGTKIIVRQGATLANWKESWLKIVPPPSRPFTVQSITHQLHNVETQNKETSHRVQKVATGMRPSSSRPIPGVAARNGLSSKEETTLESKFTHLNLGQLNTNQSHLVSTQVKSQDRGVAKELPVKPKDTPTQSCTASRPLSEKERLRLVRLRMFMRR